MKTNLSRTILGGVLACLLALIALFALPFTMLSVSAAAHSNEPDIAKIDAYVSAQMQANHIPGVALGLVHNDQIVRSLGTVVLDRPVGSRYEYCSANYDVLGLIVQTVSGQPYGTYVQQHIFAPLQMHDSFASEPEARRDGLAQGYRWLFGVPAPFDYYSLSAVPAGFLVSSAEDMAHYLVAQMNGGRFGSATVLSPTGIATMHAPGVAITEGSDTGSSYGMGWNNGTLAGIPAIWHDGAEPNVSTRLLIEPQTRWGAVLLVNANSLIPPSLTS